MFKNNFSYQLAKTDMNSSQIREPLSLENSLLAEMLVNELEIQKPIFIIPLFAKEIHLSKEMLELVQAKQIDHTIHFSVWGVITRSSFYFLIGSEFEPFSEKIFNDPFHESDAFLKFSLLLQKELGFESVEPYFSESDYYLSTKKNQLNSLSFFLYKA